MSQKIIIIGSAHPLRGGLAAYNERLAYAFQEAGDLVEIYSFSLQYPGFLFPGKTQFTSDPAPEGLTIKTKINSINPFNWWKIGREISRMKPDIVIVRFWLPFMGPCFGTILRLIRRNKHTRIIAITDNIIPHEKRPGDRIFTKYFVKPVDGFIPMCQSVKDELKLFDTKKPVQLIPHPIYDNYGTQIPIAEARKKLGLEADGKYLLFFGFIRDYKGLDLLLDAMADERLAKAGIKAIVAGEFYSDSKPYDDQIERLGIKDRLIMHTDYIPNSEVAAYFGACDMVVQPYKSATQSGISQMAYHFEVPMLVTNVGGLPEIVADGKAGYVTPTDSKAIADAIMDFYENNRKESFHNFVKEEKKRFSWNSMVEGIKSLAVFK
jgi:glycosyltransferase involved in cell wall biosynthesis